MRHMLGYRNQTQTMTLKVTRSQDQHVIDKRLKLTVARSNALDPQCDVQQEDYDERSIKNVPHLSHTGPEHPFVVYGGERRTLARYTELDDIVSSDAEILGVTKLTLPSMFS